MLALALLAGSCIEVDPLLPCVTPRDCPRGQLCVEGACVERDAAPPADSGPATDASGPETDACEVACARVSDCAVSPEECPRIGAGAWGSVNAGCLTGCRANPAFADLVASKRTCAEVIETVRRLNPPFDGACGR